MSWSKNPSWRKNDLNLIKYFCLIENTAFIWWTFLQCRCFCAQCLLCLQQSRCHSFPNWCFLFQWNFRKLWWRKRKESFKQSDVSIWWKQARMKWINWHCKSLLSGSAARILSQCSDLVALSCNVPTKSFLLNWTLRWLFPLLSFQWRRINTVRTNDQPTINYNLIQQAWWRAFCIYLVRRFALFASQNTWPQVQCLKKNNPLIFVC